MQCMEVWGGNQAVDGGVVMAGLDAWVYCRPYKGDEKGGDVYYVSSCATGRITRLLVADVSGHGETVSETGSNLRTLMRRYVNHIDQRRFIAALNREFGALASAGGFATAVISTFFAPRNFLSVCNAGHPPPLMYRARKRQWMFVEQGGGTSDADLVNIPLGIVELSDYDQRGVQLSVGDFVLCYTDSLIESHDEHGKLLGREGLLELIRQIPMNDPSRIIPSILDELQRMNPTADIGDDVTLLLFRPNGLAPRVPLGRRLAAPFRLMAALVKSLLPGGGPMPWPEFSLANLGGAMFHPLNRAKHRLLKREQQ